MTKMRIQVWLLVAMAMWFGCAWTSCWAEVENFESPALRVEISTSPYTYRVIEKSTGDVLVSLDDTAFTFGSGFYPVAEATHLVKSADNIEGLGNARYVHHSSARAPFYVTSRRYGIYVQSLAQAHYAIAQAGKTVLSFKDSELKYDILYGPSYAEVLNRDNAMGGPAFIRGNGRGESF